ncbi:hypothetical protein ACHAWF_002955 [Thalassiosira exigua]
MSVEGSPTSAADDVAAAPASSSSSDGGGASESESALADNIARKGKNAYYYAHAHRATGPQWDGKIEPRLLGTSSSNGLSSSSAAASEGGGPRPRGSSSSAVGGGSVGGSATGGVASSKAALMAKSNITNYAFLDEASRVKIYVNLPGVGECDDGHISLEYAERTMCLTVKDYKGPVEAKKEDRFELGDPAAAEKEEEERKGEDRCLSLARLYGDIEKATFRKKADKVIITLKKKGVLIWKSVVA